MAEKHTDIQQTISEAVNEIVDGQHSTPTILSVRQYVTDLITAARYEQALGILHQLAEARKAKTTNILWIGSSLKDIYFEEEAEQYRSQFDKLLLDEILFYYLKACKLYEKGYSVIREALKEWKANNTEGEE